MQLLELFHDGVSAVTGDNAVRNALSMHTPVKKIWLLAIGKAASSMTLGACDSLGSTLEKGLVITKYDHGQAELQQDSRFVCFESAHPVPDQASLDAGGKIVEFVQQVPLDTELLVLLSGGASSLVEVLPRGMELHDLKRLTEYLLANGLDIIDMNTARKSVSCIKGGRLSNFLGNCTVRQLLISDVPGDNLEDIGSGLLVASTRTGRVPNLPDWLVNFQSRVPPSPSADEPRLRKIESTIVASSGIACDAVEKSALASGATVIQARGSLNGDVDDIAGSIVSTLVDPASANGIYIWGGETTLTLPTSPGRGGRNQHLALKVAMGIAGCKKIEALCCGTDGSDGPTVDAGGLVNVETIDRGSALGLDAADYLQRADAGTFLEKTGTLVTTGPTGTNVMDLVIARIG